MKALVMVESCILALTTGTAFTQGLSASTWVRPMGVYACPSDPDIQVTWLTGEAALGQVQPFAFTRVGLGPFIDMDNRRQDEEDQERRHKEGLRQEAQRNEKWRELYRNYGYAYPPFAYAYPRLGPYYYDPYTGYYYNPNTGQYYYVSPGPGYSGYYYPNHGQYRDYRPDRERREREKREKAGASMSQSAPGNTSR
jgi:hypothetical protein